MSGEEATHTPTTTGNDDAPAPGAEESADALRTPEGRDVPEAPSTGDPAVDVALRELAEARTASLEERIEAGERAHRLLQGRLGGLGEA